MQAGSTPLIDYRKLLECIYLLKKNGTLYLSNKNQNHCPQRFDSFRDSYSPMATCIVQI